MSQPLASDFPDFDTLVSHLPDLATLTAGLTSVFRSNRYGGGRLAVVDRAPNRRMSTFPSEIVTCRFEAGHELRLLCKYAAPHGRTAYGHRGGVPYEAEVYRRVLQPLAVSAPAFYGTYSDGTAGAMWLILEYVDGGMKVTWPPGDEGMGLAAGWIGRFHAATEARLSTTPAAPGAPGAFFNRYDAAYYAGWARRTSSFAGRLHQRFQWLAPLCRRFEAAAAALVAPPPTVIHGEYTPHNVLVRGGVIYPVDWESAAVAVGQVDLATLTDRFADDTVRQCEVQYQRARWPEGPPADFEPTLRLARVYVQLRWLGDRPEWTTSEDLLWRFEALRAAGERLGFI